MRRAPRPGLIASLLAAAFIAGTVYLSYAWSERLERISGEPAINVFLRLSAFLLLRIESRSWPMA